MCGAEPFLGPTPAALVGHHLGCSDGSLSRLGEVVLGLRVRKSTLPLGSGLHCWSALLHMPAVQGVPVAAQFVPPSTACNAVGEKARTLGLLLAAGGAYAAWQQLPLEQVRIQWRQVSVCMLKLGVTWWAL